MKRDVSERILKNLENRHRRRIRTARAMTYETSRYDIAKNCGQIDELLYAVDMIKREFKRE